MTTKKKSTKIGAEEGAPEAKPAKKATGGAAGAAERLLAEENPQSKIAEHGETMMAISAVSARGERPCQADETRATARRAAATPIS